jgi:c-di-AMP phosphodiesterase-like protein
MDLSVIFIPLLIVIIIAIIAALVSTNCDDDFIVIAVIVVVTFIYGLISVGIVTSAPYQLHQVRFFENKITKVEHKIEMATNETEKRYLIEKKLTKYQKKYDYYYDELFHETPYGTKEEN